MILIFRGKAATGKSSLAAMIQEKYKFRVLSKDTIFDELLAKGYSNKDANAISYDNLVQEIIKYHQLNTNVVVDVGLAHTPYFMQFLAKIKDDNLDLHLFLFICSNDEIWKDRIQQRINNPTVLNQSFLSFEEATNHYNHYEIAPLENECIIDSAQSFEFMLETIEKVLDYYSRVEIA